MSKIHDLLVQPLTREEFAPFGELLAPRDAPTFDLPHKAIHRFPWQAGSSTIVQILSFKPQALSFTLVECHDQVTESRMHIQGPPTVIVVAAPSERLPEASDLRAFSLDRQGVMFKKGTWHAIDAFPLGVSPGHFLFLSDQATQNELFDNPVPKPVRTRFQDFQSLGMTIRLIDPRRVSDEAKVLGS
jgi:ureidoglycolate hydrolase